MCGYGFDDHIIGNTTLQGVLKKVISREDVYGAQLFDHMELFQNKSFDIEDIIAQVIF